MLINLVAEFSINRTSTALDFEPHLSCHYADQRRLLLGKYFNLNHEILMPYNGRIFGLHTNENYFHEVFFTTCLCVLVHFRLLILFCNTVLLKCT